MATRTKPLISAAVLASAAAVAVSSPAIAPSLTSLSPHALASAKVQLTTFADIFTIPTVVWTDVLFGNQSWGNTLGPDTYGPDWAKPADAFGQTSYVNPWASYCNNNCSSTGISGVAYMALDALVNGTGQGYNDLDNWKIGVVNYLFEPQAYFPIGGGSSPFLQYVQGGLSAATWYALQGTIGQALPELKTPLAAAFWGPLNASFAFNLALQATALLVNNVPLVGPITANTILSYLGDLAIPGTTDPVQYYQYGLSGILNYWTDLATGAAPWPGAAVAASSAATKAAAATTAPEAATTTDVKDATATADDKATTDKATVEATTDAKTDSTSSSTAVTPDPATPAVSTPAVSTTTAAAPETTAVSTPAVVAPAVAAPETPAVSTPVVVAPETPAVSTPAGTAPAVTAPAVSDVKPEAPAADASDSAPAAPKRPLRAAADKIAKQVTSAIGGARSQKAGAAAGAKSSDSAKSSDGAE